MLWLMILVLLNINSLLNIYVLTLIHPLHLCLHKAEDQNRTVSLKDEASALKKKNYELTLVKMNICCGVGETLLPYRLYCLKLTLIVNSTLTLSQ